MLAVFGRSGNGCNGFDQSELDAGNLLHVGQFVVMHAWVFSFVSEAAYGSFVLRFKAPCAEFRNFLGHFRESIGH